MKIVPMLRSLTVVILLQLSVTPGSAEIPGELDKLRFHFDVELADMEASSPLQELNKKYRGYLERLKTSCQQEGNLEAMLEVDKEMKNYENSSGKELSSLPELKRLQEIYRKQRAELEKGLNEKKKALIQSYEKKAKELSVTWTREGSIEDAKLALEESTRLSVMAKSMAGSGADSERPAAPPAPDKSGVLSAATKENPFVNSLGMKFVPVPVSGGPTDGETLLFSVWETRVADFKAFLRDEGDHSWKSPGFPQDDDHPVVNISWEDATAFCEWLTEVERKKRKIGKDQRYRLPTDHEWSCAVGIGQNEDPALLPADKHRKLENVYPWGRDLPPPKGAGNFLGEETAKNPPADANRRPLEGYDDGFDRTAPVGSFEPDEYGLYDLSGNAWEWCGDPYSKEEEGHPLRGGSWNGSNFGDLLSSFRVNGLPNRRYFNYGFRCVLSR